MMRLHGEVEEINKRKMTNTKKRRWTREDKRQRIAQHTNETPRSSLRVCARKALHTRSVKVLTPFLAKNDIVDNDDDDKEDSQIHQNSDIQIHTICGANQQYSTYSPTSLIQTKTTIIVVKPLIIFDVNGILCHRIRQDAHPEIPYRQSTTKTIAKTPIIPRPNLDEFLSFLSQHFCLAIWTSAKPKTAQSLVKALLPKAIQRILLFVWSQNQCHTSSEENDQTATFRKPLQQVYARFPLWSNQNTLLVDDCPEKCIDNKNNALHPPPMTGKDVTSDTRMMNDEENHRRQFQFFQTLVQHYEEETRKEGQGAHPVLYAFLNRHARGHMGYRGDPHQNK